jgi:hypothetical protein
MQSFKPTFLYIKRHIVTGILYFGKTTRNPEKYKGSGLHWKRILRKHGTEIETLWYCLFLDQQECSNFALKFSEINNIVSDPSWANLIIENGIDGAPVGHPSFITDYTEVSKKLSTSSKQMWSDPEFKLKMSQIHKDRWTDDQKQRQSQVSKSLWTDERKQKHSEAMKGKPGTKKLKGVPKSAEHNRKNSESLKGKAKSPEHIQSLKDSIALRKVCRLSDKKIMSVTHFTRWLNSLTLLEQPTVTHALE